jgi:hypothetical protein
MTKEEENQAQVDASTQIRQAEEEKKILEEIQKAKASLVSKETEDKIAKAKQEERARVEQEIKEKQERESKEKELADLKAKLEQQERASADRLEALQKKVDELITSRAPIRQEDPFKNETRSKPGLDIDNMSEEELEKLEEELKRQFFKLD